MALSSSSLKENSIDEKFTHPIGICIGPTGKEILVCDPPNHRVQVLDLQGNLITSFGSERRGSACLNAPYGICVLGSEIHVVDYLDNIVKIYNGEYEHFYTFGSSHNPKWICFSRDKNIIVTTDDNNVLVYSQNAYPIGRFGPRIMENIKVGGICCNSVGEIIITDTRNHQILIFDSSRKLLCSIRSDSVQKVLYKPDAVCTDNKDNILVADEENRICIFDKNRVFVQQIHTLEKVCGLVIVGNEIIATVAKECQGKFIIRIPYSTERISSRL